MRMKIYLAVMNILLIVGFVLGFWIDGYTVTWIGIISFFIGLLMLCAVLTNHLTPSKESKREKR